MVLGAARRMGGCDDALFTALVFPAAVFSSPRSTSLLCYCSHCCCCVHFCTYQIAPSPPRFAERRGPYRYMGGEQGAMNYETLNIIPPARVLT